MRFSLLTSLAVFTIVMSFGTCLIANEPTDSPEVPDDAIRVSLNNGSMSGFVFQNRQDKQNRVPAKVSLASGQKIIDTQLTDENGKFTFNNVEPGVYRVVGAGSGMMGDQVIEAGNFQEPNSSFMQMPLEITQDYQHGNFQHGNFQQTYNQFPTETFGGGQIVESYGDYSYGNQSYSYGGSYSGGGGGGFSGGGGGGAVGGLSALLPLVGLVGLAGLSDDEPAPATPFVMN